MSEDKNNLIKITSFIDQIENSQDINEIANKVITLVTKDLGCPHCIFMKRDGNIVTFVDINKGVYYGITKFVTKRYQTNQKVDITNGKSLLEKSIQDREIKIAREYKNTFPLKLPKYIEKLINITLKNNVIVYVPCTSDQVEALLLIVLPHEPNDEDLLLFQILGKQIGYGIKNNVLLRTISKEKENLSTLLENAEYGICVYKDWIIHYTNPKFSEVTGYSQEELLHIDLRQLLPIKERKKVERVVKQRKMGKKAPKYYYSKVQTKVGKILEGKVRVIPIVYQEQNMVLVQFHEITISGDVLSVLKNQSKYFAEIAHSLKTPFTVINGLIELQLTKYVDPEIKVLLDTIKGEIDDASNKVSQLLHVAKRNLTAREMKMRICDMHDVIQSIYVKGKALGYQYCQPNHNSKCDCFTLSKNINAKVYIDPDALMDALITMIENAYVHSPRQGQKAKIILNSAVKDGNIVISLSDKGRGIPEALSRKIFEAESTFSVNVKGHGIGLPSAKRIIEEMNGQISLNSTKNKGTTFTISFPIYKR